MDPRCPLGLEEYPESWCKLAVLRLKSIKNSNIKELTEADEAKMPGCPWAVFDQYSHYCFFQYIKEKQDSPASESELLAMLGISSQQIKLAEQRAVAKYKQSSLYNDIEYTHEGDAKSDFFEPIEDGLYL
jgi:hypothetical protein